VIATIYLWFLTMHFLYCLTYTYMRVRAVIGLWAVWLRNHGLITGMGKRFFSSTKCLDQFWALLSLMFNG